MQSFKFAVAAGVVTLAMTASAQAQFTERTIRISNGVNQEHPIGARRDGRLPHSVRDSIVARQNVRHIHCGW